MQAWYTSCMGAETRRSKVKACLDYRVGLQANLGNIVRPVSQ